MASANQEKIYETFAAVAGGQSPTMAAMIDASGQLADAAERVAKVVSSTSSKASGTSIGSDAATSVKSLVEAAMPLSEAVRPPAGSTVASGEISAPETTTSVRSTADSVTSAVLQTVFGSVPVAGVIGSGVRGAEGTNITSAANAASSSGGGIENTLESIASTVLKSGLGIVPLIGGLLGLFGGDSPAPAVPMKYQMPASIGFEGADTASGVAGADYDQMGMTRSFDAAAAPGYGGAPTMSPPAATNAAPVAAAPATPQQITVNVQAMDARSFMDRSSDIAAAVREAILNSNAINDAISEI